MKKDFGIVKVIDSDMRDIYFPNNLITIIYEDRNKVKQILSKSGNRWYYYYGMDYIRVINATPREQFLFYLNGEKPFVLEE